MTTARLDRRRRLIAWHEAGHVLGFLVSGILPAARLHEDGDGIAWPAGLGEPDAAVMRRARRYDPPAWTGDEVTDPARARAILRKEAMVTLAGPLATRTLCRFPPPVGSDDAEFRLVAAMLRPLETALDRPWPALFTELRQRSRRLLEEHRGFVAAMARRLYYAGRVTAEEVASLSARCRVCGSFREVARMRSLRAREFASWRPGKPRDGEPPGAQTAGGTDRSPSTFPTTGEHPMTKLEELERDYARALAERDRARRRLERATADLRGLAEQREELRRRIAELRDEAARRIAEDPGAPLDELRDAEARLRLLGEAERTLQRDRDGADRELVAANSRAEIIGTTWARATKEHLEGELRAALLGNAGIRRLLIELHALALVTGSVPPERPTIAYDPAPLAARVRQRAAALRERLQRLRAELEAEVAA